eukprot:jgi/Ulvmu1/795/UM010_0169.1
MESTRMVLPVRPFSSVPRSAEQLNEALRNSDHAMTGDLGPAVLRQSPKRQDTMTLQDVEPDSSSAMEISFEPDLEFEDDLFSDFQSWDACFPEHCAQAPASPNLATVFDNDVMRMPQRGPDAVCNPVPPASTTIYSYFPSGHSLPHAMAQIAASEANGVDISACAMHFQDSHSDDIMTNGAPQVHHSADLTSFAHPMCTDMADDWDMADLFAETLTPPLPANVFASNGGVQTAGTVHLHGQTNATWTVDTPATVNYCDLNQLQNMVQQESGSEDHELDEFLHFLNECDDLGGAEGMPADLVAGSAVDAGCMGHEGLRGLPQPQAPLVMVDARQVPQHDATAETIVHPPTYRSHASLGHVSGHCNGPKDQSVLERDGLCTSGIMADVLADQLPPVRGKQLTMEDIFGDDNAETDSHNSQIYPLERDQSSHQISCHHAATSTGNDANPKLNTTGQGTGTQWSTWPQALEQEPPAAAASAPEPAITDGASGDGSILLQKIVCSQQRLLNQLLEGGERMLDAELLQQLRDDAQRLQQTLRVALPSLADAGHCSGDVTAAERSGTIQDAGQARAACGTADAAEQGSNREVQSVGSCESGRVTGGSLGCGTDTNADEQAQPIGNLLKAETEGGAACWKLHQSPIYTHLRLCSYNTVPCTC